MVLRGFTDHQGCLKSIKPESGLNMFFLAITSLGAKRTRLGHQACIPSAWENHMWSVTALPFRRALSGIRRTRSDEDGPTWTRARGFHFIHSSGTSWILSVFWCRSNGVQRTMRAGEDVTWTRVQEDYFRQQILGNTGSLVRDFFTQSKTAFYAEWAFEALYSNIYEAGGGLNVLDCLSSSHFYTQWNQE